MISIMTIGCMNKCSFSDQDQVINLKVGEKYDNRSIVFSGIVNNTYALSIMSTYYSLIVYYPIDEKQIIFYTMHLEVLKVSPTEISLKIH